MDHPRFINSFPTLDAVNERDPRIENIFSLAHGLFTPHEFNAFNAPSALPNAGARTTVLPIIRNIARIIPRYKPYLANREIDRIQPEINQPPLLIMSMIHAAAIVHAVPVFPLPGNRRAVPRKSATEISLPNIKRCSAPDRWLNRDGTGRGGGERGRNFDHRWRTQFGSIVYARDFD